MYKTSQTCIFETEIILEEITEEIIYGKKKVQGAESRQMSKFFFSVKTMVLYTRTLIFKG